MFFESFIKVSKFGGSVEWTGNIFQEPIISDGMIWYFTPIWADGPKPFLSSAPSQKASEQRWTEYVLGACWHLHASYKDLQGAATKSTESTLWSFRIVPVAEIYIYIHMVFFSVMSTNFSQFVAEVQAFPKTMPCCRELSESTSMVWLLLISVSQDRPRICVLHQNHCRWAPWGVTL